jgi:hypothetical protein
VGFAVLAYAQLDFGSITAFAKNPFGAFVPKAKVTVKNEATAKNKPQSQMSPAILW